jgi:phage-related protein
VRYGTIGQGGPSASFYGGKVLSARQEMSIARGGVRGALTKVGTRLFGSETTAAPSIKSVTGINAVKKAIDSMKGASGIFGKISAGVRSLGSSFISILPSVGSLRSGLMNMASSAKGGLFKVTGINNIKNAVSNAKSAITELSTRSAQYGQAAPGFFSKASTGMMSFGKSILSGSKMFKILRVAMMSTGILAVIMAITAGVFFLIKTFQNMGAKSAAVTKNFKAAWNSIKAAISAIIKPIKDTIGTLVIMMGNATGGAGGAGKAIENISEKIKSFAESVKNFVTKYIVPVIETVMKAVIDVIRGIVNFIKGIIEIVKGNWGKGFKLILKGLAMFARAFISIWATIQRITIKIIASIAKAIVNLFVAALNKVADLVTSLAGSIVGFGSTLLGWVPGIGDGLDKISDWLHSIEKPFDSIGDIANGVIDGVADAATGVVDSIESTVKGIIENIAGKQQEIIDGAGDNLVEKGKETGRDLGEVITEPLGDALEEVIGGAGDQLKELIRDLKQKFVDLVLDSVKGALDEAVDSMKEALEKQKDAALDVFDQQLEALNKLEKAEESLTKEKEYQADRRRLIDERELQRANYIRNRALAIYEGRIDDARVLSLEEQKNSRDFNTDLAKTDEQRRQDLAKENLDALKEAIQKSKDETDKLLEEQIKAFEEAAKQITKFPPNTIQEYDQQLKELNEVATRIAGENGDILQDMMNKMKDNLKMPNENVGVFRTGLDQLVQTAIDKYGLISPTNGTIVGSTIAMLAGIEGQIVGNTGDITNAFQGIVDNVFDSSSLLDNIADEIVAPALDNITSIFESKNPFAVWIQAVKDANETILREMQKTVGHVASVVEELAGLISDAVAKLAILNEARNGGGSGGGGGGNGSTGPGTPTDGTPSPGSGGPAGGDFSTILNRNAWVTIGQKIPASIASKKMELYNIVVDSYKKYNSGAVKWQSLLDYFGSRASYATPEGKTVYDTLVSLRRVMPTQFGGAGANSTSSSSGRATGTVNAGGVQVGYDMSRGQYDQITNAVANWTPTRFFGGRISKYAAGGIVPGFMSQGIKALLHGGEYVVNANAVRNIGYATLESLNNMRYMTPSGPRGGGQTVVSDTQNVNIYVDTFIGEEQWFESMMKSYNLKIVPRNQKRAGAENRTISTYSGINRGV